MCACLKAEEQTSWVERRVMGVSEILSVFVLLDRGAQAAPSEQLWTPDAVKPHRGMQK